MIIQEFGTPFKSRFSFILHLAETPVSVRSTHKHSHGLILHSPTGNYSGLCTRFGHEKNIPTLKGLFSLVSTVTSMAQSLSPSTETF